MTAETQDLWRDLMDALEGGVENAERNGITLNRQATEAIWQLILHRMRCSQHGVAYTRFNEVVADLNPAAASSSRDNPDRKDHHWGRRKLARDR